jgi:hypothetical protein
VSDIERLTKDKVIRVTVEFKGKQMQGRSLDFRLPLPIRPDGIAADFFRACGISVVSNMKVSPRDTMGKTLKARFEEEVNGKYQPLHFEAVSPKNSFEPAEHQSSAGAGQI